MSEKTTEGLGQPPINDRLEVHRLKDHCLGNLNRGILFVLSAPAGTGKTTLARRLAREEPSILCAISTTTRAPRLGEQDGEHYHFVSHEEFEQKISDGDFLEHVQLYGHRYGTSRSWVETKLNEGKHVLLVIDTQGALQLKGRVKARFLFLMPPSLETLQERLVRRNTENVESVRERLAWTKRELTASPHYDYLIINDDLDTTYSILRSILVAEEHRTEHFLPHFREGEILKSLIER